MKYTIQISAGDFYDKLSILKIKLFYIKNTQKVEFLTKEYNLLFKKSKIKIDKIDALVKDLYKINKKLWNLENKIRKFEKEKNFGKEFIKTARSIYKNNDKRALIKKKINIITNSELHEVKQHS